MMHKNKGRQIFSLFRSGLFALLLFFPTTLRPVYRESKSIASPDSYSLGEASALVVTTPGVLENDQIQQGHTPRAVLQVPPRNGSVNLDRSGSFTYTPDPGFYGEDSFTYLIRTNNGDSNLALVTIAVPDRAAPTVTWVSPGINGEIIYVRDEPVTLEVAASDNATVQSVTFFRWDAVQGQYTTLGVLEAWPYRLVLNTSELNPEWNQVFAIATDQARNQSERQFIWLYRGTPPELAYKIFFPTIDP